MVEQPKIKGSFYLNACGCSHHFIKQDFVSGAIKGFWSKRLTLNTEEVPCLSQPAKCRKLSEAGQAKAMHLSIIDGLLAGPSTLL